MGVHVTFHSDTKIIQVDTPPDGDGVIFIDVKTDIYSDGKEDWKADSLLNKFLFPVSAVGGNPLPGSKALGSTFFLEYGWQIRPYEATHQLQINGNLYTRDGSNPYLPTVGTYNVQIINQVSSLVDSTVQQLSEIEYASFGGGIWYDETNGTAGTAYPAGTQQQPVNNAYDAFTIASERGFNTGFIVNDMNVPTDLPLSGFNFVGSGRGESLVIIPEAASVQECIFHECEVTGYLDGENTFHACLITNLHNVTGYLENCVLAPGTITLSGTGTAHFLDCWSGQPGTGTPIIDMNGSGQALAMRNYNGGIKLINKTGTESVSIDMNSGQVKFADTITNGTIVLRGVGKLTEDFSTGSAVIINQMINRDAISDAVWEEPVDQVVEGSYGEMLRAESFGNHVHLDPDNGVAGTAFPLGTHTHPVDNMVDAIAICTTESIDEILMVGTVVVASGANLDNFTITGTRPHSSTLVILAGVSTVHLQAISVTLTGTMSGWVGADLCVCNDVVNFEGDMYKCLLGGTITLNSASIQGAWFTGCAGLAAVPSVIDVNEMAVPFHVREYNGGLQFQNKTDVSGCSISMSSGKVIIDDTCTAGMITIGGVSGVEDNSNGTTVVHDLALSPDSISKEVWERTINGTVEGSHGEVQKMMAFGDHVHLDSNAGVAGTTFPNGTHSHPVDNMADALAIAITEGITIIQIDEDAIIGATDNIDGFTLIGAHANKSQLTFTAGCSTSLAQIENAYVVGTLNGPIVIRDSVIDDILGFEGIAHQTMVKGSISVAGGVEPSYLLSCYTEGDNPIEVNMAAVGSQCHIRDYTGGIKIVNKTGAESMTLALAAGTIILDGTVTNGAFIVAGNATLVDNSTGTTINYDALVNKEQISDVVWDESLDDHTTAGSMGHWIKSKLLTVSKYLGI